MKKKITILMACLMGVMLFASCAKKPTVAVDDYVDYADSDVKYSQTFGAKSNAETLEDLKAIYSDNSATSVKVQPVAGLDKDFAMGVDISSVLEVEKNGGVFYNKDGKEQDVFEILKENGVNYVRLRLWNNPKDPLFETPYGGGNNDIFTDIALAKRAARVGMKICLDFHYSDFWADPEVQVAPYEWATYSAQELETVIYDYTKKTLEAFKAEGVRPHMVQLGNEINNGMSGIKLNYNNNSTYVALANLLKSANKAVKDVSPKIKTIIHLAEGASYSKLKFFFDKMTEQKVDYDIIGLSYYSYWHGTLDALTETMNALSKDFNKPVAIMEYSYGFTELSNANTANIYNAEMEKVGGYGTSIQGQASYIRDVINAVKNVPNNLGIGAFYWEPSWLPVQNAGWASEGAKEFLESSGKDASNLGKTTWANQALFSYSGKVLPSIEVFSRIKTEAPFTPTYLTIEQELSVTINIAARETLPKYTLAYTNLHSFSKVEITWNKADLDSVTTVGKYVVNGTIKNGDGTLAIVCNVTAIENFVKNNSFEEGGRITSDINDISKIPSWQLVTSEKGCLKFQGKDPHSGFNNANSYSSKAYSYDLFQQIDGLTNGKYTLTVFIRSESAKLPEMTLYAKDFGGEKVSKTKLACGSSWAEWVSHSIDFNVVNGKATIGIAGSGAADSWAHIDDFMLVKTL